MDLELSSRPSPDTRYRHHVWGLRVGAVGPAPTEAVTRRVQACGAPEPWRSSPDLRLPACRCRRCPARSRRSTTTTRCRRARSGSSCSRPRSADLWGSDPGAAGSRLLCYSHTCTCACASVVSEQNPLYDTALYDRLSPRSLWCWARVMAANLLSESGDDWVAVHCPCPAPGGLEPAPKVEPP